MEAGGYHKAFKAMRIKRESARSADKFSCDWVFALPRTKMLGVGTTSAGAVWLIDFLPWGPLGLPADVAMEIENKPKFLRIIDQSGIPERHFLLQSLVSSKGK